MQPLRFDPFFMRLPRAPQVLTPTATAARPLPDRRMSTLAHELLIDLLRIDIADNAPRHSAPPAVGSVCAWHVGGSANPRSFITTP